MIKFADEAIISVASGKGGDGCVAFRRERFIPLGGPAGGDGGRGGDVVFVVKRNLRTLAYLRYRQVFKAENGQPGMGKNMHGRDGKDVIIEVPPGTILRDAQTNEIIRDFVNRSRGKRAGALEDEEPWIFLKGGKGGWGNTHFKSSVNQAPRFAQPGQPGQERKLKVELSLIADIGLVGFPNAGKSSLLEYFTNARPKIAPYPFTTKIPNLGVLTVNERDIILADIPGIIEGAHEGAGLGLRFLKHIARTACLAFLVDLSDEHWKAAFPTLLRELELFSPTLVKKPRILLGTKMDLSESQANFIDFKASFPEESIYGISVFTGQGLDEVKQQLFEKVLAYEAADDYESQKENAKERIFDEIDFSDEGFI
ncbi:MAG: GTPase ObgE [Spirochaetia bacterium]|nr:GTPase ObgE [Spirochaetia bacterium]